MKVITLENQEFKDDLQKITKSISKSRKIVTLTGAGISCNAGIPDFRSSQGLYKYQDSTSSTVKGKDLFDISLFRSDETIQVFCKFMESLYSQTLESKPTKTHQFINHLKQNKKLMKCYTQNIDGLERQCGLTTGTDLKWKDMDVVQLHGDLNKLSCTLCFKNFEWDDENREMLHDGCLPECPACIQKFRQREQEGKRIGGSFIGNLRPNIVLYGENHPCAELLARGLHSDLQKNPNLLLIFGTSLRVHGVKRLVKSLSKKIHEKPDGKVIFINNCEVSTSCWQGVIDYQVVCDCDKWCEFLEIEIPQLFKYPEVKHEEANLEETSMYCTPPSTPEKKLDLAHILPDDIQSGKNLSELLKQEQENEIPSPDFSPIKQKELVACIKRNNKFKRKALAPLSGNSVTSRTSNAKTTNRKTNNNGKKTATTATHKKSTTTTTHKKSAKLNKTKPTTTKTQVKSKATNTKNDTKKSASKQTTSSKKQKSQKPQAKRETVKKQIFVIPNEDTQPGLRRSKRTACARDDVFIESIVTTTTTTTTTKRRCVVKC
ncbi:unnamed protein product [Ambrosiozyma monospora]|uniref:Unnamed protein product n=1 Tax=Ambrosiozyma monospora TaxID=43982 RepID=A0ACB5SYQ7_AMBMO|nr:unnamed protein product [Ambrosiozyma monospora]